MPGRSSTLLAAILVVLFSAPFLGPSFLARVLVSLVLTVTILAALHGAVRRRWVFVVTGLLAALGFLAGVLADLVPSVAPPALRYLSTVVVLSVVAVVMLLDTLRRPHVTIEQVSGALAVYLLIGLIWGHLYVVLDGMWPGSLAFATPSLSEESKLGACIYFSYVTLTTLGYGDIQPVTAQARSLALSEAVLGQLYLAALVARIVGIHVASGLAAAGGHAGQVEQHSQRRP